MFVWTIVRGLIRWAEIDPMSAAAVTLFIVAGILFFFVPGTGPAAFLIVLAAAFFLLVDAGARM